MASDAQMKLFERRSLTAGEIALGRTIFGDAIAWPRVRILQAPSFLPFGAMVPLGNTIVFGRWRARHDFAASTKWEQGWLIHELVHVWQAARGIVLAYAKLSALGRKAYRVEHAGKALKSYNIEAQAEIARWLFLARAGEETPFALADLEASWNGPSTPSSRGNADV